MIDFEWYRSFIHVYQQRSVSAAARVRFLTQPAISQHIAALEAEVGESLFIRAPREMIPTDKGKEIYTQVIGLIDRLEEISLEAKHQAGADLKRPLLKFGGPVEYVSKRVIPNLPLEAAQFIATFGLSDSLTERLIKRELDFIISTKRSTESGVQYIPIETEHFVIVAPASVDEPVGDLNEWLDQQSWLSFGLELPIIRRYYQTHFGQRPTFRPDLILPNMEAILSGIKAGHGISVLPSYFIEEAVSHGQVRVIAPERSATNVIYLAYRTESRHDPMIQQLVRSLKSE
ncbi:LysR family transcriptional regulator [Jeotgalibacillus sp. R-1-5s-1]|uniref:LysR family transcriptional regulator n=1 Tax=Jeotgalibacillus sp. R-1-5s-1 TaxID=2555897 RepID=UPI00106968AE|nr:LysR family transcriptional regulator [Jeotgalibacillus sp. R-1-5s-1]TFD94441.1 LysR family transcriptional regulator [Jeotgalibacillus sp. R-1-5s-1]